MDLLCTVYNKRVIRRFVCVFLTVDSFIVLVALYNNFYYDHVNLCMCCCLLYILQYDLFILKTAINLTHKCLENMRTYDLFILKIQDAKLLNETPR